MRNDSCNSYCRYCCVDCFVPLFVLPLRPRRFIVSGDDTNSYLLFRCYFGICVFFQNMGCLTAPTISFAVQSRRYADRYQRILSSLDEEEEHQLATAPSVCVARTKAYVATPDGRMEVADIIKQLKADDQFREQVGRLSWCYLCDPFIFILTQEQRLCSPPIFLHLISRVIPWTIAVPLFH